MNYTELKNTLSSYEYIYLYGAGIVAYSSYKAITTQFGLNISGCIVTEKNIATKDIETLCIYSISELENSNIDKNNMYIFIVTPEEYHEDIEKTLIEYNYNNYGKLDADTEYALMGQYLKDDINIKLIEDFNIPNNDFSNLTKTVYMAIHHKDKPLFNEYTEESYTKKIQVGTTLTDDRLSDIIDNIGDNISDKNPMYCELTGTYWAWKNGLCDITGLFHYRRVLNVSDKQLNLLHTDEIDAILPLPFVCMPNTSGQFLRYLKDEDISIMKEVIKSIHGEDILSKANDILNNVYLYNYNMFIGKKEVFADYCNWIFPILNEMDTIDKKTQRDCTPRYTGRIGEILTSLYFTLNMNNWKIAHAKKIWRV